jgi:capsular exopolysaccharide synthesis family protein
VSNIAVAFARAGRPVVMLDCDLRRPGLHELFGLPNDVGFTNVMIGEVALDQALQPVPGVDRLFLLPSGPVPPNPSELLSSKRFTDVLDMLTAEGALVVIDSPPLLPVTDAAVLAASVDVVVLVAAAEFTTRKQIKRALDLLRRVDAPLVGTVLNFAIADELDSYDFAYTGHTDTAASKSKRRGRRADRKAAAKRREDSDVPVAETAGRS